jgi:poly(A) polymerase
MRDLESGMLRLIGNPQQRYHEDPVRMLRAVRFAAKLGFRIHPESEAAIFELAHLLADIPPARLFDEILKLFLGGCAVQSFELLRHYDLFAYLFPQSEACLAKEQEGFPLTLLIRALQNTDSRIAEGKPVTPAFLYAALLWEPLRQCMAEQEAGGMSEIQAMLYAANIVESQQLTRTSLPKRFAVPMREIWMLQTRLSRITGLRPLRLLEHPRFRAAYDFMLLRREAGEEIGELCQWWTEFQGLDDNERLKRVRAGGKKGKKRRTRRSKGKAVSNKTPE